MRPSESTRSRWLRLSLYIAGGFLVGLAAVVTFLVIRFQPIARDYFISAVEKRYNSEVRLDNLHISFFPNIRATGDNLTLWFQHNHDGPPMVHMTHFTVEANLANFFRSPKHISLLRLEGLELHPPRREDSSPAKPKTPSAAFVLDKVIADGATLQITPKDPTKDPLIFEIRQLTMHDIGVDQPLTYHAVLTNPKPPGLIHADGDFGPWNAEHPVDTPLNGKYTFRDADLSVFKGIAGILSSDGHFAGELDRIEVQGTTETPDFALKIGGHTVPLHTDFQATVDGTNGNTVLHPVHARLGRSVFEVEGAIDRGSLETHKTILLRTKGAAAHLEDFLHLALKGDKPPMTGGVSFDSKVKIPPGESEVIDRLELDGTFHLNRIKFTSPDVQGKIAGLSHRAEGDPENHDPDVAADFEGAFHLHGGQLTLPALKFNLPGAHIDMAGTYALRSGDIDFRGTAKLDAKVSEMTTGIKSVLLKPLDPLFHRDGAGTVLPIIVGGTRGDPSFHLDFGKVLRRD